MEIYKQNLSATNQNQQININNDNDNILNGFIGAIKVKDGLFIGDQLAAQDYEFIVTNKVSHVINTAGLQVRNYFESVHVKYLTFDWIDQDCQLILDSANKNIDKIFSFIEEAFGQGESCLVHSVRGQSRASVVLAAYFMKKYKWSLYKTIEFLNNRRPDLEIRASFIRQLSYYEKRLFNETGVQSDAWTELASKPHLENEELIITHTFLNAQMGPFADFSKSESYKSIKECSKLKWIDERESKTNLQITSDSSNDLINKDSIAKVTTHYDSTTQKSILKVPYDCYYFESKFDDEGEDKPNSKNTNNDSNNGQHTNKSMQSSTEASNAEPNKPLQGVSINNEREAAPSESKKNESEPSVAKVAQKDADLISFDYAASRYREPHENAKNSVDKQPETSKSPIGPKLKSSIVRNPKQSKQNEEKPKLSIKKPSVSSNSHQRKASDDNQTNQQPNTKKKRPRSNDDKVKEISNNSLSKPKQRKLASRDNSEKNAKDLVSSEAIKKRNIIDKFTNTSDLISKSTAFDSRNIYASNSHKKKNWNSVSLKQTIYKKELNTSYQAKVNKIKSQGCKMGASKPKTSGKTQERKHSSFKYNESSGLSKSFLKSGDEFAKLFGSSAYNPAKTDFSQSKQKLYEYFNSLLVSKPKSDRHAETQLSCYANHKTKKKIEKKSIKFSVKRQNFMQDKQCNKLNLADASYARRPEFALCQQPFPQSKSNIS